MGGAYAVSERLFDTAEMAAHVGFMVMSSGTAAAEAKCHELGPSIEEHVQYIMTGGPNDPNDNHHRRELRGYVRKLETFAKRMVGKRATAWANYAKELLRWINGPGTGSPPLAPV